MNLDYVTHRLEEIGWKPAPHLVYAGGRFDLQFSRRIRFEPWLVLIQSIPVLDIFTLGKLQSKLEWVFVITKGKVWYRNLNLYLIAGKVTQQALHALKMDHLRLLRFSQAGSGTSKLFVVDESGRKVHGPFPQLTPHEKQSPFDLTHIFMQALSPDGVAYPSPVLHDDVASMIDRLLPTSALKLIQESTRPDLAAYRVEALSELGCFKQAEEYLDQLLPNLQGNELGRLQRFKARYLFGKGQVDEGIWLLDRAACNAKNPQIRAAIISTKAEAYALKRCFKLAEDAIREALQVAPDQPRVSFAQARLYLLMDRRLEARDVLESMRGDSESWVNCYIDFELANIALLLGEFDEARRLAISALDYSAEIINPLNTLTYLAMLRGDISEMERLIGQIESRSPRSDILPFLQAELERLRKRLAGKFAPGGAPSRTMSSDLDKVGRQQKPSGEQDKSRQRRLESFPSLVQRLDHCGPCTIELVLRYWKGGLELTNSDIARRVMLPQSGTPIHHITEFFHLVGFATLCCIAPVDKLKLLVDAGFPAIVDVNPGSQGHVTVVIGYDDEAGTIELQDPITHQVLPMPVDDFNRFRRTPYDSAIVAFPFGQGHEVTLARLGLFPDEVLALLDQASLALEVGNHPLVSELLERAARLRPQHGVVWAYWLEDLMQRWQSAQDHLRFLPAESNAQVAQPIAFDLDLLRSQFYSVLERARRALPETDFIHLFTGRAALLDGDLSTALASFQKMHELSPSNPDAMAAMAECQFGLREVEKALESAWEAVKLDPGSVLGNVWLARCLSFLNKEHADYYAHISLELAPGWWMSHLAMAEVHMAASHLTDARLEINPVNLLNPPQAAWQELDSVLSRSPNEPEALVLRAYLMMSSQDYPSAQAVLETALSTVHNQSKPPMALHRVNQAWCLLYSNQGLLDQASQQVIKMLEKEPGDPWALQFQADLAFKQLIKLQASTAETTSPDLDISPARELYLSAIQANQGDPGVVQHFLEYLLKFGRQADAVELSKSLGDQYNHQTNLIYLHGAMLRLSGQSKPAADCMLDALAREGAIQNRDQLCYTVETIIQGLGPEQGDRAIIDLQLPKTLAARDRDYALGVILALYPKEMGARARQLLEDALAENPEDFEAVFWLSRVAINDEEREELLRQTVALAPHWTQGRMVLAGFLIEKDRCQDALDLTTGHEYESLDILARHVFCLNNTGQFEQAAPAADRLVNDPSLTGERTSFFYRLKIEADTRCGEHARVLDTIRQAQTLFPEEHDWHFLSCLALSNLGRLDEANAALVEGRDKGMDEDLVHEVEYWIAMFQDDRLAALDVAQQAQDAGWKSIPSQQDPTLSNLAKWSNRYLVLMADLGREQEVRKYLDIVFKDYRVWESSALELSKIRNNQLTLKCAERILKVDNIDPSARYNAMFARAVAYRNLDHPEARHSFEIVRTEFPLHSGPLEQLALYAALDGNIDRAAHMAEQAVAQGKTSWSSWAVRGLIYFLQGDREAAVATLKSAWNRTSDDFFTGFPFWWLYFALSGEQSTAEKWKAKAYSQAQSSFDRRLLDLIQSHID